MILVRIYFALLGLIVIFGLVYRYQRLAIYRPQRYGPLWRLSLLPGSVVLEFDMSSGRQTAFYVPPERNPDAVPDQLWVLFHGIGATALDWMDFIREQRPPGAGFLLVDYPGYGLCEGQSTELAITRNAAESLRQLAAHFDVSTHQLAARTNILGYSLGAAAGLNAALIWPVRHIVLLAPFSSLHSIAVYRHGPIGRLLWDRFDNRAALDALAARKRPPAITIIHGDDDRTVPIAMGRELAARHPDRIRFHAIRGARHGIVQHPRVRRALGKIMAESK